MIDSSNLTISMMDFSDLVFSAINLILCAFIYFRALISLANWSPRSVAFLNMSKLANPGDIKTTGDSDWVPTSFSAAARAREIASSSEVAISKRASSSPEAKTFAVLPIRIALARFSVEKTRALILSSTPLLRPPAIKTIGELSKAFSATSRAGKAVQ